MRCFFDAKGTDKKYKFLWVKKHKNIKNRLHEVEYMIISICKK